MRFYTRLDQNFEKLRPWVDFFSLFTPMYCIFTLISGKEMICWSLKVFKTLQRPVAPSMGRKNENEGNEEKTVFRAFRVKILKIFIK